MSDERFWVGVDLGGTNLRAVSIDGRGRVLRRAAVRTPRSRTPAAVIAAVVATVRRVSARSHRSTLAGVAVGVPGLVLHPSGIVAESPNFSGWNGIPLRRRLERTLRASVAVENDANVAAVGEHRLGAGRGARHLAVLTLGTGVGGGLVLDGRLYRGADGTAAELGHVPVEPTGPRCGCGSRGCLEAYASATHMRAAYAAAVRGDADALGTGPTRDGLLRAAARLRLERVRRKALDLPALAAAARRGEPLARAVFERAGFALGVVAATLANALDLERLLVGGGVSASFDLLEAAVSRELRRRAFRIPRLRLRVARAALGAEAGLLGAAVVACDEFDAAGRATSPR
jgi:glucokinase